MNKEIKQALEVLKANCDKYENCNEGCDFYESYECYLYHRVPEEYEVGLRL